MRAIALLVTIVSMLIIIQLNIYALTTPYTQGSVEISRVEVTVVVYPEADLSYVSEKIYLSRYIGNLTVLYIPLISSDITNISSPIRAYGENGRNLSAQYIPINKTIEVLAINTSYIELQYVPLNLITPIGIGTYELDISLGYEGVGQVSGRIIVPRDYEVFVVGVGDYSVERNDLVTITLHEPENYTIILMKNFTPVITTPTVPSETTPTTPYTQTGETPQTQSTPTTTQPGQPETTMGNWLPAIIAIIVAIAIIAVVLYLMRGRREEIVIETVSPTDILSDDVIRDILLVVGDAGEKGIAQNRLVSIIGKPKSTISRKIRRLSEAGYVDVERAGRSNIIRLTGKGWEVYRKLKSGEIK